MNYNNSSRALETSLHEVGIVYSRSSLLCTVSEIFLKQPLSVPYQSSEAVRIVPFHAFPIYNFLSLTVSDSVGRACNEASVWVHIQ